MIAEGQIARTITRSNGFIESSYVRSHDVVSYSKHQTTCGNRVQAHGLPRCQAPPLLVRIEREFARYLPVRLSIQVGFPRSRRESISSHAAQLPFALRIVGAEHLNTLVCRIAQPAGQECTSASSTRSSLVRGRDGRALKCFISQLPVCLFHSHPRL